VISDEAVEAALREYVAIGAYEPVMWEQPKEFRERIRGHVLRMLEAALPQIQAEAWDEGAEESADHWALTARNPNHNGPVDPPRNPYRSQP
jgi:hypothetical protein